MRLKTLMARFLLLEYYLGYWKLRVQKVTYMKYENTVDERWISIF